MAYADDATVQYRLRETMRQTYDQGAFYGRYRVRIRERLAAAGHVPASDRRNLRRVLWLVRRGPRSIVHRATRVRWFWVLGQLVGERRGNQDRRTQPPVSSIPVGVG